MEETRKIRVLVLDGDRHSGIGRTGEGIEVVATFEGKAALFSGTGQYKLSQYSLDLASAATPELYDAIVVGNNMWVGRQKAARIPQAMRSRTLIVWNHRTPDEEDLYRGMGFTRFGQRYSDGECDLGVREFIQQIAAEMAGA